VPVVDGVGRHVPHLPRFARSSGAFFSVGPFDLPQRDRPDLRLEGKRIHLQRAAIMTGIDWPAFTVAMCLLALLNATSLTCWYMCIRRKAR
jgi:hypothetical protein